jgi:hypothetical protein
MQVTESLIVETPVSKFMPELVSVDELLMLADGYKHQIDALAATLHQHDKGSEQHRVVTEELNGMMRRRRFLVKAARYRQQQEHEFTPAQPKVQR